MCLAYKANRDIPRTIPAYQCPGPEPRVPAYILETLTEAGLD